MFNSRLSYRYWLKKKSISCIPNPKVNPFCTGVDGWNFPLTFQHAHGFVWPGCCFLSQVSVKGRTSAVSLLQMATYSGLCVLVRLLAFRSGQQPFPLSLMEALRDPHILKVGVGCYEDGKRLTRDYGLSLTCTVDLRYLALRQRYGLVVAVCS